MRTASDQKRNSRLASRTQCLWLSIHHLESLARPFRGIAETVLADRKVWRVVRQRCSGWLTVGGSATKVYAIDLTDYRGTAVCSGVRRHIEGCIPLTDFKVT